jgi:hypothetical protein
VVTGGARAKRATCVDKRELPSGLSSSPYLSFLESTPFYKCFPCEAPFVEAVTRTEMQSRKIEEKAGEKLLEDLMSVSEVE